MLMQYPKQKLNRRIIILLTSKPDLGYYEIRFALGAFGWELPKYATGRVNLDKDGVPINVNATLKWVYPDEVDEHGFPLVKIASLHCSFRHHAGSRSWHGSCLRLRSGGVGNAQPCSRTHQNLGKQGWQAHHNNSRPQGEVY